MAPPTGSQYLTPSGVYDSDGSGDEDEVNNRNDGDEPMTEATSGAVDASITLAHESPKSAKSDSSSGGVIVVKPRSSVPAPSRSTTSRISPTSSSDSDRDYIETR
ncbi:hypothetical protein LTR95_015854, partial [Oleoguttula sp. CCFEE 5521]